MTQLNNELSLECLNGVSGGGGGIMGTQAIRTTKETKSSDPAPTTSSGPNTDDHVSTGGHKSASFDPVTIRF